MTDGDNRKERLTNGANLIRLNGHEVLGVLDQNFFIG
jgi:hypothetical protein